MATLRTLDDFAVNTDTGLADQISEQATANNMGSLRKGWASGRLGAEINPIYAEISGLRAQAEQGDPRAAAQADALQQQVGALQQRQGMYAPEVGRVEDVNSVGSALSYAGTQVGQGSASMVDPIAASATVGGAGRLLGMAPGPIGKIGRALGKYAAPAAAYGINQRQMTGEFYGDASQDPELMARTSATDLNRTANIYGGVAGLADTALPHMIGKQITGAGLRKGLSSVGPGAKTLLEMGMEGATEGAQDVGSKYAQGLLNPNRDTSGDASSLLNSVVGGAIGSGPMAAGGAYADAGYRRAGHTSDIIGAKAGDMYDMASGAIAPGAERAKGMAGAAADKVKGWIGAGKKEAIDLMDQARDEDGEINLGKAAGLAGDAAESRARDFLGEKGGIKLDPQERKTYEEAASLYMPEEIANSGDTERQSAFLAEQQTTQAQTIGGRLADMADNDPVAADLYDRIAQGDRNAIVDGAQHILDRSETDEVLSKAGAAYAVAGKLGGLAGKAAIKGGKGVLAAGKAIYDGASAEMRKKNAQGEEQSPYAAWQERTKFASGKVTGRTMEEGAVAGSQTRPRPEARIKEDPAAKERSQRRAELFGEILAAEARDASTTLSSATRAEPELLPFFMQDMGYKLADMAESWGMGQDGTKPTLNRGARQVGNLSVNLNSIANSLRVAYKDKAGDVVEQLRSMAEPNAAPLFDHLAEQIAAGKTAQGRKDMAALRANAANQMMMLVPSAQSQRMYQHAGGAKDHRMQLLEAVETIANGHAEPGLRQAFEKTLGADTLKAMMGVLNGHMAPDVVGVVEKAVGPANAKRMVDNLQSTTREGKPKTATMFGDGERAQITGDAGVNDETGEYSAGGSMSAYDKAAAEKSVSRGAGPRVYGGALAPTLHGGNERTDPFAPIDKLTADEKLARENENRQRRANGEPITQADESTSRIRLFKKGEKLFSGEDALANRMAAMEQEMNGGEEGSAYDIKAQTASQVMKDMGYQPGKVLAVYRDYLAQDAESARGKKDLAGAKAHLDNAKQAREAIAHSMNPEATPAKYRAEADQMLAREQEKAKAYFDDRYLAVGEGVADRVPDKLQRGEVMNMTAAAEKAMDNIEGAAFKAVGNRASKEYEDAKNKMLSEGNFLMFSSPDGKKVVPIQASRLVGWARPGAEAHGSTRSEKDESYANRTKDDEYVDLLLSGISAAMESGHVKAAMPYKVNKFGSPEKFGAKTKDNPSGIPPSLGLATMTQYSREQARQGRAEKAGRVQGPQLPPAVREELTDRVAKEQAKDEVYVADPHEVPEGETSEFDDQMFRTKAGKSIYDALPFETKMDAARKVKERSGPIDFALIGENQDGRIPGSQEKALNMIVARIKAGETPWTKDGPAGGVQYLYPAAAALKREKVDNLPQRPGAMEGLGEHMGMLRGQIARVLRDTQPSDMHKVAVMRLMAPAAREKQINAKNVDTIIRKAIEQTGAESGESLGYFKLPAAAPEMKDISKKPLEGSLKPEKPAPRPDPNAPRPDPTPGPSQFQDAYIRTRDKVGPAEGETTDNFIKRAKTRADMRSASMLDTIDIVIGKARAAKQAAPEVASAGLPKSQPKPAGGFELSGTGPYASKDQGKASRATAFIGRGSAQSSTNRYAGDAQRAGVPVNPGKYSASDAVFVSAEGNRTGRLAPDTVEISRAMSAGATIITDVPADRARPYNVGERAVAAHLEQRGYSESKPGTWTPARKLNAQATAAPVGGFMKRVKEAEAEFAGRLRKEHDGSWMAGLENAGSFGPVKSYAAFGVVDGYGDKHAFAVDIGSPMGAALAAKLDKLIRTEAPHADYVRALQDHAVHHAMLDTEDMSLGMSAPYAGSPAYGEYKKSLTSTGKFDDSGNEYQHLGGTNPREVARILGFLSAFHKATGGKGGEVNWVRETGAAIGKTGSARFNAQAAGTYAGWKAGPTAKAQGAPSTDAEVAQAKAYFAKVLDPKFKTEFKELTGHSGEFIEAQNLIQVSLSAAAGILPTAYHEAFHAFFSQYAKGDPRALKVMQALADDPKVLARLEALLHEFPAARAQLTSGEERMAYIYQFWAAGKLDIGPGKPRNWLQSLAKFFRGVVGTLRGDERAVALLEAFHSGGLKDPTAAAKALDKLLTPNSWPAKARRNFDGLIQQVGRLTMPAQDILGQSKSRAARRLMAQFYASPGDERGGMKGEGMLNAKKSEGMRRANALANALEGMSERDHKDVVTALQRGTDPSTIAYKPVREAVAKLRWQLEDFHKYMTGKGLNIGYIKDYFPVVWDTQKLTANREEFVDMLLTHYKSELATSIEGTPLTPTEAAHRLTTVIIDRQVFDGKLAPQRDDGVLIPFFESANHRELDWIKPEHREPFLDKRLMPTMTKYFSQGVRAAEYTSRFGEDGKGLELSLKRIDQELAAEGQAMFRRGELKDAKAGADWATRQFRDVRAAVGAMEGTLGKDITDTRRKLNSWATVYQNVRLLPLSLFASVVDPLAMVARGADMKLAGEAFVDGLGGVLRTWKETITGLPVERQKTEWERLAEMVGATESAVFAHHVSEEYSSEYMSPRAKKINDAMFKFNGMEAWNRGMRVAATKGAVQFIMKHKENPSEHSARWLKELGLKASDVVIGEDGKLITDKHALARHKGISLEQADQENHKMLFAINRWVEGGVLTPNSAQRPAWSSDPNWSFMFHLKQFTYSFQQTILKRAWSEMHHGNLAPLGALAWFVPTMIASDITKGLLVGGGELPGYMKAYDVSDWLVHGTQRAGLTGYGQFGADAMSDPFSLLGPMIEQVTDAVQDPIGKSLVRALPANALYKGAIL